MDCQYRDISYTPSFSRHLYGPRVHLLSDPYLMTLLSSLCSPEVCQPRVNALVETLYKGLVAVVANTLFPRVRVERPTRMQADHSREGVYRGEVLDPKTRVVSVDLARAGVLPSHVCYEMLHEFLDPEGIRQDHIYASRTVDPEGQVTGASFSGSKVGGPVRGAFVLFPDPMGATGGTLKKAVEFYESEIGGGAGKYVAMHLIVTPEYLKAVSSLPDLEVFALRLDRGLSPDDVLEKTPGEDWARERGLNEQQYIVPGAGGVGEILNNAFV